MRRAKQGELEIDEDPEYHRLVWRIERIGWVIMAIVLVAGLAGLLGPGPLSKTIAGIPGSALSVEYNRFERYQSPTKLHVHLSPANATSNGIVRLSLNRQFVESIDLSHVDPAPLQVEAAPSRFTYAFQVAQGEQPVSVTFHYQVGRSGRLPLQLELEEKTKVVLTQFIYP